MITTIDSEDELAKSKGQELIADVELIPEIEAIEVEPYLDHSGDRALQITFHVRREVAVDDAFLDRFQAFKGLVQSRILRSDLGRFPYTQLEQAA